MCEENKQLILRQIAALNAGELDTAEELTHPDFFDHDAPPSRANGPDGSKETLRVLRGAFAGFRIVPLDVLAESELVAVRARVSGRQVGEFSGVQATGREFSIQQIHIWRVADGKIVEHWASRDDVAAMRQLGLVA